MTATPALLSLTGHHGDFPKLLLEALDELLERQGEALGGHVADDHAIGDLEKHLLLLAGLGVGVGHVEAEVDDSLLLGGMNAIRVRVERLHLALVNQYLD